VDIAESRFKAVLVSQLELVRAQGEVAVAQSRIPALENSVLATVHRLGVLLGREPTSLVPELSRPAALPEIPDNLAAGLPSELLRQRPDIRKAERDVAAATARIGVSTADLFPRFSLTGSFGYLDDDLDSLSWRSGHYWRVGPAFRWPILNFKRILSAIDASKAVRDETLAQYEKAVLTSLEEVENALVTLSREKRRTEALVEAVRANDSAVGLAQELYRVGAQSYLAVLDAEAALYNAQDQLAQSRQNRAVAFVSLYKALGGGWQDMEGRPVGEARQKEADASQVAVRPGG
jgi:NodT family efflux transporter outer membrane factor (OMF) lipoprotein